MGATAAKEAASVGQKTSLQVDRGHKGYYAKDDLDGYSSMRTTEGSIKSRMLDKDLLAAVADCLKDDGKISAQECRDVVLPKIADGRAGRSEFTCNERWTVRYALGEFAFEEEARKIILDATATMTLLDLDDKPITDEASKAKTLYGPTLEELGAPPEKRAKGEAEGLVLVDGMMLDRGMLLALQQGAGNDGVVDALEAVKIFGEGADGGSFTRAERWTLRFMLSSHTFTDAAFFFLVEALSKLQQTDDATA
mmetsp:Transcript_51885/g.160959  ORF Transcript_51885/g.160959 Transcript_51885/m.160959 type:complete len:252 (+) Transcript_51885:80-835(+)